MEVTKSRPVIEASAVQPMKARDGILVTPGGHANEVRPDLLKAVAAMEVTDAIPSIAVRARVPWKASLPMEVTTSKPVIEVRAEQKLKAAMPMDVTASSRVIEARAVQLRKA